MQIKDIYFIKTILDRATAGSHNGEVGYYSVSDNMFSEGHSCYCDNGNDYYSDLKGIFNCATTDFSCPGFEQAVLENGNYHMTIVKLAGVDHLTLLFGGITINLNFDGNYYYTQNNYASYGGTLYRFDYVDGEIAYVKTYIGGSYATVSENVETTLFSSASIMMYYGNADRDVNYAKINSEQGIGSGGWQVPNPNPTRKIMLNGVDYTNGNNIDDILVHHFDTALNNEGKATDNKGHIWTVNNTNRVSIDNTEYKFSDKSLHINGAPGYIQSEVISDLNWGTSDFTVDFWININNNTGRMCPIILTNDGFAIDINNYIPRMWFVDPNNPAWLVNADSPSGGGQGTIAITHSTWNHIALIRNESYLTLYVNGQQSVQANIGSTPMNSSSSVCIRLGTWDDGSSYQFYGSIDELRVTNKAVWTSTFTPPIAPYNDDILTDIKLNGITPNKIMLNGVCYFERQVPPSHNYIAKWNFTKATDPLIDEINNYEFDTSNCQIIANQGIIFSSGTSKIRCTHTGILRKGYTYEIDFSEMDKSFSNDHGRLIMLSDDYGFIYRNQTNQWEVYNGSWMSYTSTSNDPNVFDGKTLKMVITNENMLVYSNDTLIYNGGNMCGNSYYDLKIGSVLKSFYNMTISGVRIYENEE